MEKTGRWVAETPVTALGRVKFEVHRRADLGASVYTLIVPDSVFVEVNLDALDRAVVNSPAKTIPDTLQSLEILLRRAQEQGLV